MTSPPHDPAPATPTASALGEAIESSVFSFLQHRIRDVIFVLEVTPPERYRFIYVNAAFEATTGIPPSAVVGKWVEEVIPPESIALVRMNYRRALDSGASVHWDEISEYPTGRKVGEVTVTPVPAADGKGSMLIGTVHDVTERHQAQARLGELEERSRLALEAAGAGSFDWHAADNLVFVSEKCRQLLGFASDSYDLDTLKLPRLVHPDELPLALSTLAGLRAGATDTFSLELRMRHLYGHWIWLRCQGRAMRGADGRLARVFGACSDITRAKEAEEAMERASLVFAHSSDAIAISDSAGRIIMINPGFTRMRGYERDEIIGQTGEVYDAGMEREGRHEALRLQALQTGHAQGEVWSRHKDGHPIAEQRSLTAVRVADGAVRHYIEIASDITKAKKDEELLWRQANYDSLTGLPNRHLFLDRLRQAIRNTHRGEHPAFSLLYIDLDQFKEVNDTLGHPVGDQLLKEAAQRLLRCTRETDTVSRIGGDEFTVLLVDLDSLDNEDPHVIERVAHDIIRAMSEPFLIEGETLHVSASIGVTHFPADGGDADSLLKHADQAMYAAKHLGRNRFAYFSPAMQARAQERRRTSEELRQAIAREELQVHYQPIVELATGRIVKAEALVRWRHPERGWVSPVEFIPLAEETGLIFDIGEWVFRTAVTDAARWLGEGREIQVSINVSPLQIAKGGTSFARCMDFLASQRLPRHAIVVEVTEGTLLQHDRNVEERLRELEEYGLALALDDFGTGYSSLSYLQQYRFEFLKIDRAFVGNMQTGSRQLALCRTIIAMAHTLDMRVISEGIADEQAAELLRNAGCDYGQGFYFHQPMPAASFEALLRARDLPARH
ncbi:EAL domain-containing protein [Massilia sp. Mn16-1_5]|uniref:sensor domain-containing protein n=1 Tax=Massilia sp. Mn16-1_5 TaxID=2079199 RepID=UPI00109ECC86|nr:EAL domain-containing protein [Massilia sp. Mn16-1_5]THC45299.1 GGDEF domain-containing protein [Massilia sp. Mn16-1_5]